MRSVVRPLGQVFAVSLAVAGLVLVIPAMRASAGESQQQSRGTHAADSRTLAISITGMTPQFATSKATVTVHGTLANHTGSPVSGIDVQAQTSTALFNGRLEMSSFSATGSYPYFLQPAGSPDQLTAAIPNGGTVNWTVSFPAGAFYSQFGVFPVQVRAGTPDGRYTATARTFLPFWPSGSASSQPRRLQVSWIWPLIDTPQQGACAKTLATSQLAGSVAAGGRLSTLLGAGAAWAQDDNLTWDIDPALLSDVSVMTRSYFTNGNAACSGRFPQEPSAAAGRWLTQLRTSTAGQPAFLTPYADVDVAALSHAGLDGNLKAAYRVGDTVAAQILPRTFGATGKGSTDGAVLKAAWPADGIADAGVATSLASYGGINTLVLNSGELPSSTPGYDNALGRTTSGIGTSMSVLLADSGITSLLGSASSSPSEAGQFAFTQDFLAQTAMISSEGPNSQRSLVIAPPPGWDPSPAEASALLSLTHGAPWLQSVKLSTLTTETAKLPSEALAPKRVSHAELSGAYLDGLRALNPSASLFENLLYEPSDKELNSLNAALAATASSAWRGAGSPGGWRAMAQLTDYFRYSERKVEIISSKKILLAGTSGETPVSVQNGLDMAVQVKVVASTPAGSQLQAGPVETPLTVQPGKSNTVHMPLHSATIGTTTVQLRLVTQNGSPLGWTTQQLSVEVTRFGRSLLLIIGGALGILVLTSAFRLHRKRKAGGKPAGTADHMAEAGGAG